MYIGQTPSIVSQQQLSEPKKSIVMRSTDLEEKH